MGSGSEWMDAAEKARKKAEKEAAKIASLTKEDKFDAFGNKIEEKKAKVACPKSELKKIKKRVAAMRKAARRCGPTRRSRRRATRSSPKAAAGWIQLLYVRLRCRELCGRGRSAAGERGRTACAPSLERPLLRV